VRRATVDTASRNSVSDLSVNCFRLSRMSSRLFKKPEAAEDTFAIGTMVEVADLTRRLIPG